MQRASKPVRRSVYIYMHTRSGRPRTSSIVQNHTALQLSRITPQSAKHDLNTICIRATPLKAHVATHPICDLVRARPLRHAGFSIARKNRETRYHDPCTMHWHHARQRHHTHVSHCIPMLAAHAMCLCRCACPCATTGLAAPPPAPRAHTLSTAHIDHP